MKQVRKIYEKAFKEKAVQLSYDRTNVSELARDRSNSPTVVQMAKKIRRVWCWKFSWKRKF
ncbi:transposase-like protein [Flavobacterium sp. CAN_S2]